MQTFTSVKDVQRYVIEALAGHVNDYDVDAIVADVYRWQNGTITLVDDAEFWAVVERHTL